jgi:hypothetical protein
MDTDTPDPIRITLGRNTYELKCSRNARKGIDAIGGYVPALQALRDRNFDRMAGIIIAGASLRMTSEQAEKLADTLWEHGDEDTYAALVKFVVRYGNGGKDPAPETDNPDDGEADQGNA